MNNTKKILLIGKTGSGKSALANVLLNKNNKFEEVFKENEYSVSGTGKNQEGEFEYQGTKYLVIDTMGTGSTLLEAKGKVEEKIIEFSKSAKSDLSQILFIIGGKPGEDEINLYNLLNKKVFGGDIFEYTTIVRTKFDYFDDQNKCEEDYRRISENIGEFAGVIKRYVEAKKVVHVNNPSISTGNKKRDNTNKETRKDSREKLLSYLVNVCKDESREPVSKNESRKLEEDKKLLKELEEKLEEERKELKGLIQDISEKQKEITQKEEKIEQLKKEIETIKSQELKTEVPPKK